MVNAFLIVLKYLDATHVPYLEQLLDVTHANLDLVRLPLEELQLARSNALMVNLISPLQHQPHVLLAATSVSLVTQRMETV